MVLFQGLEVKMMPKTRFSENEGVGNCERLGDSRKKDICVKILEIKHGVIKLKVKDVQV